MVCAACILLAVHQSMPDIASWGADKSCNRMFLRIFRSVDTDHGVRGIEEKGGEL
jgi:hypothetical protein